MKEKLMMIMDKKLEKRNLRFDLKKELNDKFKGYLVDNNTGTKIPFEIQKCLQLGYFDSFADMARESMNLTIKAIKLGLVKEGK